MLLKLHIQGENDRTQAWRERQRTRSSRAFCYALSFSAYSFKSVVLGVQHLDQQHQHYLETWRNVNSRVSPYGRNPGGGAQCSVFNKPSGIPMHAQVGESLLQNDGAPLKSFQLGRDGIQAKANVKAATASVTSRRPHMHSYMEGG